MGIRAGRRTLPRVHQGHEADRRQADAAGTGAPFGGRLGPVGGLGAPGTGCRREPLGSAGSGTASRLVEASPRSTTRAKTSRPLPGPRGGPRHQGTTSRRRRKPRPGHGPGPGQTGPAKANRQASHARVGMIARGKPRRRHRQGGQAGQAGAGGRGQGQAKGHDHGMPRTPVCFATEGGRRHRGQGPGPDRARLGQSRITNITSTRPSRRKSHQNQQVTSSGGWGEVYITGAGRGSWGLGRPDRIFHGGGGSAGGGSTLVARAVWPARSGQGRKAGGTLARLAGLAVRRAGEGLRTRLTDSLSPPLPPLPHSSKRENWGPEWGP